MEYINPVTGQIREFHHGQPIPIEYVLNENKVYEHTPEAKKAIGEKNAKHMKGKHWFNNGITDTLEYQCPEGFSPGRLKRTK